MQPRYADAPPRRRTHRSADALATGLGWFSIALGAAELLAPGALARCLGLGRETRLVRGQGLREIVTGIGILASDDPRRWIWGRIAGDLTDIAMLGRGLDQANPRRAQLGMAIGTVAVVTILDLLCARSLEESSRGHYVAPDYRARSGFPKPAAEMRGAAAADPLRRNGSGLAASRQKAPSAPDAKP